MGDGAFAIHLVDRHFFAIGIVPANRRVDDAFVVGQHAVYNRPVTTRDRVVCKLHGKRLMGGIIFTDDDGAGRILIDSVDDSGAQHAVDAGKLSPTVIQYGVDKGMAVMPGCRMDDHILWLVDNQNVAVLIENVQRDVFRLDIRLLRFGQQER